MKRGQRTHHFALAETKMERLYSIFATPVIVGILIFIVFKVLAIVPSSIGAIHIPEILLGTGYTLIRLFCAYILALVCAIPLALISTSSPLAEKIFLPTFDILESIPILAFFPILILFFIHIGFANGAAIFILFISMLWNIVFTVAGGLKIIPQDITFAAQVFGIKKWNYFRQIVLPSIFPEMVTGSILAFAQGWNIIIVAEVIHTYMPFGTHANDLQGIGSILVDASATGQTSVFVVCLGIMIIVIGLFNYFIWQRLIHYAERFKFE